MRYLVLTLFLLFNLGLGAEAQAIAPADADQFHTVISSQLEAFKGDRGSDAYSYAAPVVKQIFPDVESFMGMVKRGYPMVYRNQGYEFGAVGQNAAGNPTQQVRITGLDGEHYIAAYTMEKQPDGSWKISGCTLMKIEGLGV